MPTSNDQHLWVSWDEYHRAIEGLAHRVHKSGWKFDIVLCLARGGLRPGDIFSRIFEVPLAILSTSSYREDVGTVRGELEIAGYITMASGVLEGRILLVDDLVDSGITLQRVAEHLTNNYPAVIEIKTAVIWRKGCSSVEPDFYLEQLNTNPWIHQPFEDYDTVRPDQLVEWHSGGGQK